MIERILLAVDDSPGSLEAAHVAIALAGSLAAELRVVHVSANHLLDRAVEAASGEPAADVRRARSAAAVLTRVGAQAAAAGVDVRTDLLSGDAGPAILDLARRWPADLLVVGKSARVRAGGPYLGTRTRHILEFADQPVLVVPAKQ